MPQLEPQPIHEEEVLLKELEFIQQRRQAIYSSTTIDSLPAADGLSAKAKGLRMQTVGLALSGGGIRSAAFNLGVLQALAGQKLLANIDYLSTVSGGGYIGSWLSAWIYRDGDINNVQRLIVPDRNVNATAERVAVHEPCTTGLVFESEPEPIRHLRENTNYLAPQPGLLSLDSLTLLAIYIRNVSLNSLVVIPAIVAVQLIAHLLLAWYSAAKNTSTVLYAALGFICLTIMFIMLFATFWITRGVTSRMGPTTQSSLKLANLLATFRWSIYLLLVGSFFVALHLQQQTKLIAPLSQWFEWLNLPAIDLEGESRWYAVVIYCGIGGLLHTIPNFQSYRALLSPRSGPTIQRPARWIFSGFLAGAILMLLSLAGFLWLKELDDALRLALIVPWLLWSFFFAESVQLGVLGRLERREIREKWSYFHAYGFLASLGWLILIAHSCVLPNYLHAHNVWFVSSPWAIFSSVCLWLAQGDISTARRPWLKILIKAGPPIVLAGMLVLAGKITHKVTASMPPGELLALFALALLVSFVASHFVDVNIFSLQELYQNRLVRAFLGASRFKSGRSGAPFRAHGVVRTPDPITHLDPADDVELRALGFQTLEMRTGGPLHLVNTAINLQGQGELEYQERMADSFVLSPLYCGSRRTGYRSTAEGYADNMTLGTAFAISGAAVSPNMGYYSAPGVTALLTFFNLRLGAWLPNPRANFWKQPGPVRGWFQLLAEVLGRTSDASSFVYLSDGGHFDNLGVYELLRRRCRFIIVSDAGADPQGSCTELAMMLRKAKVDFGITIEIDLARLKVDPDTRYSAARIAVGRIIYPETDDQGQCEVGHLIYIKSTMNGSEPADIQSYRQHNSAFPHQSTVDQFFSESQFESYRHLGETVAASFFSRDQSEFCDGHEMRCPTQPRGPQALADYLEYVLAVEGISSGKIWQDLAMKFSERHEALEIELQSRPNLQKLQLEMQTMTSILDAHIRKKYADHADVAAIESQLAQFSQKFHQAFSNDRTTEELLAQRAWVQQATCLLNEVMQALQLQAYETCLARGWMRIARRWILNSAFQSAWPALQGDYSQRFIMFVNALSKDDSWAPLARSPQNI